MTDVDTIERDYQVETGEGLFDGAGEAITSPAAERQLLGYLISRPDSFPDVRDEVAAEHFSDPLHRRIFELFAKAFADGWGAEEITLGAIVAQLGGDPNAKIVGDKTVGQYLASVIAGADLNVDPADAAAIIFDCFERRVYSEDDVADVGSFYSRFGLKMWVDQNEPGPQYDFLVEDLIPEGEGTLIMGESQTGKSFLTFHLAMCGARGIPFFGRRILKPFGVIWLAHEAAHGAAARMRAYARHHDLAIEDLPFGVLTKPPALWPGLTAIGDLIDEMKQIERRLFRGVPLKMIVVDTYNAATPGASEIDSQVVSQIRLNFDRIREETGAATVIVGHTNALGKHRGNEQLTNNIDTVIHVTRKTKKIDRKEEMEVRDDDGTPVRSFKVRKQREGRSGDEYDFVLREVEDGTKNKFGRPRTSCVIAAPKLTDGEAQEASPQGNGEQHVGARVTRQTALFVKCLLEAIDQAGEYPPASLELPRSVGKVVDYDHVKRLMSQKMLRDEDNTEDGLKRHRNTMKSALKRAREHLLDVRVIGTHSPFIWWTGKPVKGVKETQPKRRDLFDANSELMSDDDLSFLEGSNG